MPKEIIRPLTQPQRDLVEAHTPFIKFILHKHRGMWDAVRGNGRGQISFEELFSLMCLHACKLAAVYDPNYVSKHTGRIVNFRTLLATTIKRILWHPERWCPIMRHDWKARRKVFQKEPHDRYSEEDNWYERFIEASEDAAETALRFDRVMPIINMLPGDLKEALLAETKGMDMKTLAAKRKIDIATAYRRYHRAVAEIKVMPGVG